MTAKITIELVFANPDKQALIVSKVEDGTTARKALLDSALVLQFPQQDFVNCALGVWGKTVNDDYRLVEGDRVEAYRPLRHDPREYRRQLASRGQSMGTVGREARGKGD